MAAQPRITARSTWRAARAVPGGRHVAPSARRWFVVHYPVMGDRPNHQFARDIEGIHLRQGWAVVGYNFLVSNRDGEIMEGAGRDVRGIHSPPRNVDGWGVCVTQPTTAQGRPTAPLSQAARNSTRALYEWLCTIAGRRLGMAGHNTHHATACPGPDLSAWVRSGMPAGGPTPAPQPQPAGQEDLMASATSANGTMCLFLLHGGWAWDRWQRRGDNDWNPRGGYRRFAHAPNAVSIDAFRTDAGHLHVQIRNRDGSTQITWQRPGETSWQGGRAGQSIAAFQRFAGVPAG